MSDLTNPPSYGLRAEIPLICGSILFAVQEMDERRIPGHLTVRIYAGPTAADRRPVGSVVLRDEEVDLLEQLAFLAGGEVDRYV